MYVGIKMDLTQPMDVIYQNNVPWRAIIELTNACQFNCIHCFHSDHKKKKNELSTDDIKRVIVDLYKLKTMQLTLTGGEPTLRADIVEIIEFALANKMHVQLLSNGNIDEKILNSICKFNKNFSIEISLLGTESINDSITNKEGAFRKAVDTIKKLVDCNMKTKVNTIVMKQNFSVIGEIENLCRENKLTWSHSPVIFGDKIYNFRLDDTQLLKYYKKFPDETKLVENSYRLKSKNINYDIKCNAGRTTVCVDSEGNVYPCSWMREKIGSVPLDSVFDIWTKSEKLLEIRESPHIGYAGCLSCKFYSCCKRCPAYAFFEHGAYNKCPHEWCRLLKAQEQSLECGGV